MQVVYLKRFSKDLNKITQPKDRKAIAEVIEQVKQAEKIEELPGVKKLAGFDNAFRLRSGNYRIGVFMEGNIVQFARVAHRKDIYKMFP
ncbi:MAG: type II toxin-antitoxin system RelE family toxin [Imperialibacter sp.]|uniref:type II toxin-antitoxin system RelE family toxin n=1 Tax=Imperialibacter sp. TaxID=2038411 RepID=UPI0030DB2AAB|tara:strand:+ start:1004 stop:1270 length:267 start_codon:yes stop_codon:yes gene_type:complete